MEAVRLTADGEGRGGGSIYAAPAGTGGRGGVCKKGGQGSLRRELQFGEWSFRRAVQRGGAGVRG